MRPSEAASLMSSKFMNRLVSVKADRVGDEKKVVAVSSIALKLPADVLCAHISMLCVCSAP